MQPSVTPQRQAGTVRIGGQTFITGQPTITDAAGRVHVRSDRVTYAQRKAAAQRRVQAMRQAAAKKRQAGVK
jgi:regulator of RNase E activity RraA